MTIYWTRETRDGRRRMVAYHDTINERLIVHYYTVTAHTVRARRFESAILAMVNPQYRMNLRRPPMTEKLPILEIGTMVIRQMADALTQAELVLS